MGAPKACFHVFGDRAHPEIRRVVWISLALTTASFVGLVVAVQSCSSTAHVTECGWIQFVFSWAVGILGGVSTLILAWVLFPVVATFFVSLLLEDIAKALDFSPLSACPTGSRRAASEWNRCRASVHRRSHHGEYMRVLGLCSSAH